ncbi:hypothetical protein [Microvirga thermotolerans]|uniref:Uncharacterized protein n=1 Tax=Microvirga thermotolerans TaxID=2651334 RepID=A0A5P9JYP9_9HYPH|nr:hypothetical protein [Microvirga thermotolerans]QFU16868.1 hypothetical protein GDR74_11870 [Microvirga thermotolerans]
MKKLALVLAFTLAAASAGAQQRPFTPAMPCFQIQQLIAARGAAVLSTGTHTYDRFVRDRSFCEINEYLDPAWVPARDTPQCPIGYRCRSDPPDFFFD